MSKWKKADYLSLNGGIFHQNATITFTDSSDGRSGKFNATGGVFKAGNDGFAPSLSISNPSGTKTDEFIGALYSVKDGILFAYVGGSWSEPKVCVWDNGDVGIGTGRSRRPVTKLHVEGNIYCTGQIVSTNTVSLADLEKILSLESKEERLSAITSLKAEKMKAIELPTNNENMTKNDVIEHNGGGTAEPSS